MRRDKEIWEVRRNAPTVFFCLWESIRRDWGEGVNQRGLALLDLLPHSGIVDQEAMRGHIEAMTRDWNLHDGWFDGRHWARGGRWDYMHLFLEMEPAAVAVLDTASFVDLDGQDAMSAHDCLGHEEAMALYHLFLEEHPDESRWYHTDIHLSGANARPAPPEDLPGGTRPTRE